MLRRYLFAPKFGGPLALILVTGVSCLAPPAPEIVGVRILLAAATVIWLPGWLLACRLRLLPAANTLEHLALAFALGCGLIGVESMAAYALRMPMHVLLFAHLIVTLALLGGVVARITSESNSEPRVRGDAAERRTVLLVVAGLLIFGLASGLWASRNGPLLVGDGWFHLAGLTKLIRGTAISPDCSVFKGVGADPRYPWSGFHLAGAMVATAARAEAMQLYVQLPRVLPFIGLCALAFLVRRVLSSEVLMWGVLAAVLLGMPIIAKTFGYPVRHPYPRVFMELGIVPVYMGLVAEYVRNRNRLVLCCIGLSAFAAASFHTMGVLNLSLLVSVIALLLLLVPVGWGAARGYLWAAAVTGLAVGARAIVLLANYPRAAVSASLAAAVSDSASLAAKLVHPISDNLFVVYPEGLRRPLMVVAVGACCLLMPLAARRPGLLLLVASALLFPLVSLNPLVATHLAPWVTVVLLRRLYGWPQLHVYVPILLLLVPMALVRVWEWQLWPRWRRSLQDSASSDAGPQKRKRRGRARHRPRRRKPLAGTVLFGAAALMATALWAQVCYALMTAKLRPTQGLMWAGVAVILALPLVLRITGWRPDLTWNGTPHRVATALLLSLMAASGLFMTWTERASTPVAVDGKAPSEDDETAPWLRWKYRPWELDERTMIPTFMAPLADLPAGSAVVYSPFTWCETAVSAFVGQYVLLGRSSANPKADMAGREVAADRLRALLRAKAPSDELLDYLRAYEVDYVLCPPVRSRFCGALDEYPELFPVVDQTSGSTLYRVNADRTAVAAARRRTDPWRLPARPKRFAVPLGRYDGLALLGVELDRDEYRPGDTGRITFYWECLAPMERNYRIVCHMDSPQGPRVNVDHQPLGGAVSSAELTPGTVFRESYLFAVPRAASGASYYVRVALWERQSGYHPVPQDSILPVTGDFALDVASFGVTSATAQVVPRPR